MKRSLLTIALALAAFLPAWAGNTSTTVEQVTEAVALTEDVDYHITSTTPFSETGSIDITNTDHAVIIFDNLKPSLALKQMKYITINGVRAVNETNCQVRLYNRGAIVFPYGKESSAATGFHPLVVYDEKNCEGNSCELFGLENNGGYMNTLTAAKMNNKIRSFTLKRGYMVTFSLRSNGYGYSRCFIADSEDLKLNLPALMDQRISSYRVFRWYNTSKSGLANDTGAASTAALNVTSCYSFGLGESRLPDVECVPHHIYENWPSASECGTRTYSPHMKTNNEPGNSADDHPQTVDEILNNWESLMRTGMRLCSPSSHDGSLNHLRAFMDSIDARGWRCEIIDLHCYWPESSFNTWSFYDQWANRYGRPIWISEWVWGASWNSNGAFASGVTEAQNRDAIKRITANLNSWDCIERYYYWNSERDPSRIYKNGNLTSAGEYYASMNTGLGYKNYKNYIPKTPPFYSVSDLSITFSSNTGSAKLTWTNRNMDLTDVTIIQKKESTGWKNIDTLAYSEASARSANVSIDRNENIGLNEFRVLCQDADGKNRYSNVASVFIGGAISYGDLMTGHIESNSTEASTIYFATQETQPVVITGLPSFRNISNGVFNHVNTISKDNFKFNFEPWSAGTSMNFKNTESTDYIILQPGSYSWGDMIAQVDTCEYMLDGAKRYMSQQDTIEVIFNEPFAEGVVPVVLVQNVTSETGIAVAPRVLEVTNKGFKMKLIRQAAVTKKPRQQHSFYIAITPGSAKLGETGMRIHAGRAIEPIGGSTNVSCIFRDEAGDTLYFRDPYILAASQTHHLDFTSSFRKYSDMTVATTASDGEEVTETYGVRIRRQMDGTATIPSGSNTPAVSGDYLGWLVIDHDPNVSVGISAPLIPQQQFIVEIQNRRIVPSDPTARIYSLSGAQVKAGVGVLPGVYLVTNGKASVKVLVK
jgi:hypothetical protein